MFPRRFSSLLCAFCLLPLTLAPFSTRAASSGSDGAALDVNFFYDNLKNDGSWFNTVEYGDVWQPYIAYKSDSWRPYTDGYWSYTDGGWMFVSYEDFGWAVYHYGRWTQLKDIGWAWVPGTEWAPAWVTWRESKPDAADVAQPPGVSAPPAANVAATNTDADPVQDTPPSSQGNGGVPPVGQNYVGWAPLPPDPEPVAYDAGYAYGPTVDVDYGIDPYDYCFTDVRFFGAPFLGAVIFDSDRSYYCCDHSVNITDFRYSDRGGYRGFYNGGPRYDRFRGVGERAIPQYNIRRQQGRLAQQAVRAGRFNQISGREISAVAPRFSQNNVHDGRVSFSQRGTLPVSRVGRERPANAANNDGPRERAQNTFRQQGEAFRAQNPDAPSVRRGAQRTARTGPSGQPGNPGERPQIATTPRAQQEERAARQAAGRQGPGESSNPVSQPENRPGAAADQPSHSPVTQVANRRKNRRNEAASARNDRGENPVSAGARQQARESRRSARQGGGGQRQHDPAPRVVRQSHNGEGGGHHGGGGGEHHGGDGHGGGGEHHDGGGKKH